MDRLCLQPCAFDLPARSRWWAALVNGAAVRIVPQQELLEAREFAAGLKRDGVNVLWLTVGLFNQYATPLKDLWRGLKYLLVGGDALDARIVRQVLQESAPQNLLNGYGPTETTTFALTCRVEEVGEQERSIPLGRPISQTQVYVLDEQGQPVPVGVWGEICIGGHGVARGYLGRPELTAERFVSDPFGEPGGRLYRTGDMGRWRADGQLEYQGRLDHQVKVRGYRIELGEIESQLQEHQEVGEAVVVVRQDDTDPRVGEKRLVAYVTPRSRSPEHPDLTDSADARGAQHQTTAAAPSNSARGQDSSPDVTPPVGVGSVDVDALRTYLRERVPAYMVPAAFVVLPRLPLTPNGKVDRKSLPTPSATAYRRGQYEPPQGEMETALAQIWQTLLKVDQIGRNDDFFQLGGHSLLAVQMASRVRLVLERELALREVFESPTIAALARILRDAEHSDTPIEHVADHPGPLPLSYMQQRLWYLDQLDPDASRAYHVGTTLRLQGELDVAALRRALDRIVCRHEALRTVFRNEEGQAVQVILPQASFQLVEQDLSELRSEELERRLSREIQEEAQTRFDLSRGPLIRGRLLTQASNDYVLLLRMHHIISDGWSIAVLVKELSALYAAYRQGDSDPLTALTVQYADYTLWLTPRLQGDRLQEQLHYWQESLQGAPELLSLPTDHARPTQASYRGDSVAVVLEESLSEGLRRLSQRHGTTLFMTLYSAFAVLLSHLSRQSDVVIGTPVANRPRAELEDLIGFFVNMLALRCRVNDQLRVGELLQEVKRQTLRAYHHQEVPLEQVVEMLRPHRSLSYNPLFQAAFALQNTPRSQWELPGLKLSAPAGMGGMSTAQFDLTLSLQETRGRIVGVLNYAWDLFDRKTIEGWAECLKELLQGMVRDDQQRVAELPLLNAQQREQLLKEFNDPIETPAPDRCIHELFEEQVERTPDAVAVVYEDQSLTYAQLNERANQLARYLKAREVEVQERVALWLPRSVELLIAQLAVLKCGASYVPLDIELPPARQQFVLQDCAARRVLCWAGGRPCELDGIEYIEVEPAIQRMAGAAEERGVVVTPECIAYVTYTSGSTGQPKGVVVPHRAVNHLVLKSNYVQIETTDRIAFAANPAFDASTFEIWGALLNGASVAILPKNAVLDTVSLRELLAAQNVTVMFLTTALFNQVIRTAAAQTPFAGLKCVLFGGEACDPQVIRQALLNGPPRRLLHMYGPTETTTFATFYPVESISSSHTRVPIGGPLSNTRVYLLDERLQPVPIGVSGEIYIGGAGVACGYLNHPQLTAERFPANPFSDEPGARMYRTGDLGRWSREGNIEFLGRNDHQVKIRGFRIELGEIESQLQEHPEVGEAAVVVRQDGTGHGTDPGVAEKRLVAYVTPRSPEDSKPADLPGLNGLTELAEPPASDATALLNVDTLRAHLKERVPAYMVPAAFVVLPRLPLTPNGKVDRKALPTPSATAYRRGQYQPPQGEVEIALAQIWQSLLKVDQVGRDDDFFQLGGYSLLGVQMVSRVRAVLERELTLSEVFENPTLADLARVLLEAAHSDEPIEPVVDRSGPLPLSYMQQRLWYLDQLNADASQAYHIGTLLRLQGELDIVALHEALDRIVCRHEALRTVFRNEEGQAVQVILPPSPFSLLEIDLSVLGSEERERQLVCEIQEEARTRFDLGSGPLIRGRLLRQAPNDYVLLLRMHHIIADGWSIGLLVKELSTLYTACRQGGDAALAELAIQYADYTLWQRQRLQEAVLQEQLHYWQESLQGAPELLSLPTDHARPAQASYRGGSIPVVLEESLSEELRQLSQRHGTTLFMTLYSGFAVLLSRLSGQDDVVIGTPVANRPRAELEDLIGFFVNTLALRCRVNSQMPVCELLQAVKRQTLSAYSHQEVPFERVVDVAQPQRSLGHNPIFQVMFALQNAPRSQWELPGLKLSAPVGMGGMSTAQFDLTLSLQEEGGWLVGTLNYATDLFDRETVGRWAEYYKEVLWGLVRPQSGRVGELSLLPPQERARILREFNTSPVLNTVDRCLHELLEEQAERTPDAVAVVYEEQSLTYGQLNTRANRLAHYLQSLGAAPEKRVGLCAQRSPEMVIGLLGILKSGGAYVPLDASYPSERQGYVLKDAQPVALVVDSAHSEVAQRSRALGVPVVELGETRVQGQSTANLEMSQGHAQERAARAHTLAYLIYTSGSTGEPKGVMVEHAQVVRLFESTRKWFEFGSTDVWTLFHSVSFDFSVWELWGALLFGGRLVVVPQLMARSPQEFYELLCRQGVTVLNQTPSAFRQLIAAQRRAGEVKGVGGHALRRVILGGEALEPGMLKAWYERHAEDAPRLVNMYGITETTVHVTYREMQQRDVDAGGSPIGSRLPDLQLYVLDEVGEPVPVGVVGELYVGGEGLARGYLNRPELTAQRFVPDGFSGRAGARLYRTGDLGRWKEDGSLEYVGRNDEQVKVRGYRIELGEIESQLQRHAQVSAAAVVAQAGASAEKRLVAYYTLKAEPLGKLTASKPGPQELRQYLEARLPRYMVPAGYVELESIPLTGNGKVDRKRLPAWQANEQQTQYEAPRTRTERTLCEVWERVLQVERVGVNDNYFALGGDSILSIQVLWQARAAGLSFTLADLLRYQTIRALSEHVQSVEAPEEWVKVGAFELLSEAERQRLWPAEVEDAYPLSRLQEGMYFHSELDRESATYHDVFSNGVRARFEEHTFNEALQALVQRRTRCLRSAIASGEDGRLLQVVYREVPLRAHVEDLTERSPQQQKQYLKEWFEQEKRQGFEWDRAPLLRVFVHVLAAEGFRYTLSFHHLILDGWSLASLQTELLEDYLGRLEGQVVKREAPKAQFRDYIAREQRALSSLDSEHYWKEQLSQASVWSVPIEGSLQGERKGRRSERYTKTLESGLSAGLLRKAQELGAHPKVLLLAAHVKVMSVLSGQRDVLTGLVWNGRLEEEDGDRVLGLYLNSVPVRVKLGDGSWRELIGQVQRRELELIQHRRYPLSRIQEVLGQGELFNTLFNYVQFHVYEKLNESGVIIGVEAFEQTSYALVTTFSQSLAGERVSLSLGYDCAVLTAQQVQRIAGYYEAALEQIAGQIEAPHDAQTLLSDHELEQVLRQFNATTVFDTDDACIHDLFEAQVQRTPDAVAVVYEDQSLTYAQLNERADQLARYLQSQGVGPDHLVGLCLDRSAALVIGLLGILKAGGAYVPLDTSYPARRLAYLIADAAPVRVLTQASMRDLPALQETCRICLDTEWAQIERCERTNLDAGESEVRSGNLAYLIYTSGSTGEPKGVAITHRNTVNMLRWAAGSQDAGVFGRTLFGTSINFDLAVYECLAPLILGGSVVVAESVLEWGRQARRQPVTLVNTVPAALSALLEAGGALSEGAVINLAGEALQRTVVNRIWASGAVREVCNLYGPSETTTYSSWVRMSPEKGFNATVGAPINNTRIYVLDEELRAVPLGMVGEICIAGAGVARGYLKRPGPTAERFVCDPFAAEGGTRMYRTGDRGRWWADGTLEFLGRADHQLKVRGYRVELGEIESHLLQHQGIREAVVVAREQGRGERQLVGYVSLRDAHGLRIDAAALRAFLQERLPGYMVPAAFIIMPSLPLTPNGKIDRKALPDPGSDAYGHRHYEPPQGEIEIALAQIWQELLQVEQVGRQDDFFALGGHSLLALRLVGRVGVKIAAPITIADVFESRQLAALGERVLELKLAEFDSHELLALAETLRTERTDAVG